MKAAKLAKKIMLLGGLIALLPGWLWSADGQPNPLVPKLSLSMITQNSARVDWNPTAQAGRYELSFGTDPEAKNRGQSFVSGPAYTLNQLMANTIYRVKVRAILSGQAGEWSDPAEFSTEIPVLADLEADSVSDTSAHLTWSDRYRDLPEITYELSYGADLDATSKGTLAVSTHFIALRDLAPHTMYFAKLRVKNPKTASPWSIPISFTTQSFATRLIPTTLTLSGAAGAFQLHWNAIPEAESYEISHGIDVSAGSLGTHRAAGNELALVLSPNTRYYFRVRAMVAGTPAPWSKVADFLTPPEAPKALTILGQTTDQVILGWLSAGGNTTDASFQVQWNLEAVTMALGQTTTANTTFTLFNLKPNQTYQAKVRSRNARGVSEWCKPVRFTTLPLALTELRISDISQQHARIEWPGVYGATGYEFSYGSDTEAQNKKNMEVKNHALDLTDLIPDVTYYVKVRPILTNSEMGAWSQINTFTTFPFPATPKKPMAAELGSTYVSLTWTPVPDCQNYEVIFSTEEVLLEGETQSIRLPEIRLRNLKPNTLYRAKVRAENAGGPGEWSETTQFTTLPKSAPHSLNLDLVSATEIFARWQEIEGNAPSMGYRLRVAAETGAWQTLECARSVTANLPGLLPNTRYQVQICAYNQSGSSAWSQSSWLRTPPALPGKSPANLRAKDITDISALVSWDAQAATQAYQVSLGTDTDASNLGAENVRATSYPLQGLVPDTNYFIKVKSINTTGEGPWSDCLMLTTRPSPPIVAPKHVCLLEVGADLVSLGWDLSEQSTQYEVSIGTDPHAENSSKPTLAVTQPYIFTHLRPQTTYYVKVRNVNRGGGGPWSQTLKATTLEK